MHIIVAYLVEGGKDEEGWSPRSSQVRGHDNGAGGTTPGPDQRLALTA
jgi:hypothetical protein